MLLVFCGCSEQKNSIDLNTGGTAGTGGEAGRGRQVQAARQAWVVRRYRRRYRYRRRAGTGGDAGTGGEAGAGGEAGTGGDAGMGGVAGTGGRQVQAARQAWVVRLVQPLWAPDTCNGIDDDCDGQIDESGCDDGSVCTTNDQCVDGICVVGSPLECDDGIACNGVEQCNPAYGCYGTDVPPATDGLECPVGVIVGAGSYAVGPPAHEGDVPRDMVTRELYITSEVAAEGRPIPSNQWLTDLLIARHGGKGPFLGCGPSGRVSM